MYIEISIHTFSSVLEIQMIYFLTLRLPNSSVFIQHIFIHSTRLCLSAEHVQQKTKQKSKSKNTVLLWPLASGGWTPSEWLVWC
jgi:hypothetical protein